MRSLMKYHALHHYQDDHRTFGVTSPLWDWAFGTLPGARPAMKVESRKSKIEMSEVD